MKKIFFLSAIIITIFNILVSCKKDILYPINPNSHVNKSPIANAGLDRVILFPKDSVLLDGTQSADLDGYIISYQWTKISGPSSSSIRDAEAAKTVVNDLVEGVYQFELSVIDNMGLTVKDIVQISLFEQINVRLIQIETLSARVVFSVRSQQRK